MCELRTSAPLNLRIPPEVAERLGYYVYLYTDPRTDEPFYVGKGKGGRVLAHISDKGESMKTRILKELAAAGLEPRIEILSHGLPSEETALRIEAAVIDALELDNLANLVSGWQSVQFGRVSLEELVFYYASKPVDVTDSVLLIRVTRLYRHAMPAEELYDATRGQWRIGQRRKCAGFALAVFDGIVREVYEIQAWHPAGTTTRGSPMHPGPPARGRWEFTGCVAPDPVRNRYYGRSVARYFRKGHQNPVVYVNC